MKTIIAKKFTSNTIELEKGSVELNQESEYFRFFLNVQLKDGHFSLQFDAGDVLIELEQYELDRRFNGATYYVIENKKD